MIIIYILLFLIFLGLVYYHFVLKRKVTHRLPENYPDFSNREKINTNQRTIVCFGDSNTHGNISYNWVNDLNSELPNFNIFNAGQNADLTFSALRRIQDVLACNADFVVILLGSNDLNASLTNENKKKYKSLNKLKGNESPEIETFIANYKNIVQLLQNNEKTKIAIMTLPLMGEDIHSDVNQIGDRYSQIITQIASEYGCQLLDIRKKQIDFLIKNPSTTTYKFSDTENMMIKSVVLNNLLGWSWDKICKLHKTQLSPDFLHQNSIAGTMIKNEVTNWINKYE